MFRKLYMGTGFRPMFADDLVNMTTFLPKSFLVKAMELNENVNEQYGILLESAENLKRQSVLEWNCCGTQEHINAEGRMHFGERWIDVKEQGFVIGPTQFGIDYYLWAMGNGKTIRSEFLKSELKIPKISEINLDENAVAVLKNNTDK